MPTACLHQGSHHLHDSYSLLCLSQGFLYGVRSIYGFIFGGSGDGDGDLTFPVQFFW
jgi:hypothetical protein